MPSADFEIYSSAGEGTTREILSHFERVRSFFERSTGASAARLDPVRVIVFGSPKEYTPYRPNEVASAFYTQVRGRDYIVLGGTTGDVFPIVTHEYCHLVVQHAGLNLPLWLNEGIAEVYSTLKPAGREIIVGTVIPGRLQALSFEKTIPLPELLAVDRKSPYYNEKSKAGVFYDESWALAHMLQLSPAYRTKFTNLIAAIQTGTPSQRALESVYGKSTSEIENDLRSYVRQDSFQGALFPVTVANQKNSTGVETASQFDVALTLLDLTDRPGREEETRKKLQELASSDPKRPEPFTGLGYLAMRAGDMEEARKNFRKSVELGSRNPTMLWDYGRMAMLAAPEDSIRALGLLLADQPGRKGVRLVLAQAQLNTKQWAAVLDTLRPIRSISAADAPVFFRQMAFANLNLGDGDEARAAGKRWLDNAGDGTERENAEKFQKYLDFLASSPKQTSPPVETASSLPDLPAAPTPSALPSAETTAAQESDENPLLSPTPHDTGGATFRSNSNFVSVDVQVLAKGQSVVGLQQKDFAIWDNGRPQTISSFGTEDQPIDLVLLLDYSGSTHQIEERVKGRAAEAMSHLNSKDRVGVMVFDTNVLMAAPLTSNFERVDEAIRAIPWTGRDTELNATLLQAVLYLQANARPGARRHIIVLTDNDGARAVSDETVRNALWESDTIVNLIRFDTPRRTYSSRPIHGDLLQFVTATGGELLDDNRNRMGTELVEMFRRLHERYVILYRAPEDKPGSIHQVKVALQEEAASSREKVQIHARTGYLEGQANSSDRSKM